MAIILSNQNPIAFLDSIIKLNNVSFDNKTTNQSSILNQNKHRFQFQTQEQELKPLTQLFEYKHLNNPSEPKTNTGLNQNQKLSKKFNRLRQKLSINANIRQLIEQLLNSKHINKQKISFKKNDQNQSPNNNKTKIYRNFTSSEQSHFNFPLMQSRKEKQIQQNIHSELQPSNFIQQKRMPFHQQRFNKSHIYSPQSLNFLINLKNQGHQRSLRFQKHKSIKPIIQNPEALQKNNNILLQNYLPFIDNSKLNKVLKQKTNKENQILNLLFNSPVENGIEKIQRNPEQSRKLDDSQSEEQSGESEDEGDSSSEETKEGVSADSDEIVRL